MRTFIVAITLVFIPAALPAAGSEVDLLSAGTDINDKESLRRGAQFFIDNCSTCHAAKFMRYERLAQDLEISEEDVMKNMVRFGATKMTDSIPAAITTEAGKQTYGIAPPDLSLEVKYRGVDWVYSYLMGFYADENTTFGYNNRVMNNVAMPWSLAGYQASVSEEEFSKAMRDLTNFMDYMAEPIKPWRQSFGKYVIIFLLIMLIPVWLLKKEYWKDID
ncbi:MAG: cytochrome c1 [Gammaproteobacteria bacterium]|jgi:ubiquinol-cytochrome c reductase cytochrome c1 subunit|nr:cytochrome c1 [Gammaproteobacteria bacterium]MDP6617070.1 cytochrome c1 [Gammaproteobacteria bacterium]